VGEPFSVVVLAGGQSRRMGRDKAALTWEREDILGSLLTRFLPLSDDVLVVSNIVRKIPVGARQVADVIPGKGPLSGIHAGLVHARHSRVFFTACDLPFLIPEIATQLVAAMGKADGSVVVYQGQLEPLVACYRKQQAGVIEKLLAEEKYSVRDFLAKITWVTVAEFDLFGEFCFMNLNTCDDYEKAKVVLAKGR
jgi:molybdopterin-guanine dinucleotide biosynthesis protein A